MNISSIFFSLFSIDVSFLHIFLVCGFFTSKISFTIHKSSNRFGLRVRGQTKQEFIFIRKDYDFSFEESYRVRGKIKSWKKKHWTFFLTFPGRFFIYHLMGIFCSWCCRLSSARWSVVSKPLKRDKSCSISFGCSVKQWPIVEPEPNRHINGISRKTSVLQFSHLCRVCLLCFECSILRN